MNYICTTPNIGRLTLELFKAMFVILIGEHLLVLIIIICNFMTLGFSDFLMYLELCNIFTVLSLCSCFQ